MQILIFSIYTTFITNLATFDTNLIPKFRYGYLAFLTTFLASFESMAKNWFWIYLCFDVDILAFWKIFKSALIWVFWGFLKCGYFLNKLFGNTVRNPFLIQTVLPDLVYLHKSGVFGQQFVRTCTYGRIQTAE